MLDSQFSGPGPHPDADFINAARELRAVLAQADGVTDFDDPEFLSRRDRWQQLHAAIMRATPTTTVQAGIILQSGVLCPVNGIIGNLLSRDHVAAIGRVANFLNRTEPDAPFFVLWEEFVIAERQFRRMAEIDDSDETMAPLSDRCLSLRDRLITMPTTTVESWACKLKICLLSLANLPDTVFNIDSFSGPIPAAIEEPEKIEDAALPWLWNVIADMSRPPGRPLGFGGQKIGSSNHRP